MYKILKNTIEMDDYSVQKLSNLQPPEPFEWNTVEGTELNVSDCIGGKGKIEVKGNTYQKQLSGKNLFGISDYEKTYNGVQIKIKDGEIILNGTCTGTGTAYIGPKDEQILNGTYTISRNSISGTMSGSGNINLRNVSDDSIISGTQMSLSINSRTFTLENANVEYGIYLMKDATFDNYKFRPQLVEGDTPDYDFEPYCGGQAAPNPSCEIPIKVVTGDNVVKHVGKNLLNLANTTKKNNGITATTSNGVSTVNGTTSANSFIRLDLGGVDYYFKRIPAGTYTLSANNNQVLDSTDFLRFVSLLGGADTTPVTRVPLNSINAKTTFTLTEDLTDVQLQIRIQHPRTLENLILKPQLELSSTATSYEPYREEDYRLDLWKENEFDINNVNKINAVVDQTKITASASGKSFYIECQPNTRYKISRNIVGQRFVVGTTSNVPVNDEPVLDRIVNNSADEIIIKTNSNARYIVVYYLYNSNENEELILSSMKVQEAIELCKIGDNEDILFKNEVGDENYNAELEEDAWYKKGAITKAILNGTEPGWGIQSINSYGIANFYKRFNNYNASIQNQAYINYFSPQTSLIANETKTGFYLNYSRDLFIRFDSTVASTVEAFKTWLSTHNLEFYYVHETPIYEKITNPTLISQLEALRKAKWFKGVNHWWTETNNLEPVLKGTYRQAINE